MAVVHELVKLARNRGPNLARVLHILTPVHSVRPYWNKLINSSVVRSRFGLLPLRARWSHLKADRPQVALGLQASVALVAILTVAGSTWFVVGLRNGLPKPEELGRIGEMDQATTIFDAEDHLAFTVFKEQRIDVPLDQISPNVIHAIVAIEDRPRAHCPIDPFQLFHRWQL